MSNITFKQILTYFSQIGYNHEQIRSFGWGDFKQLTMDVETKIEPLYPRMYIVPGPVDLKTNEINYSFSIVIADIINENQDNLEEVLSDNLSIAQDIFTVFHQSYTERSGNFSNFVVADFEPDVVPFIEQYETTLGGWTMNLKLSQPFDYNSCLVPLKNVSENVTWAEIMEIWKNIAQKWNDVRKDNQVNIFPNDESFSSYLQVLSDFKEFCYLHKQVNSYGFGPREQLTVDRLTKIEPLYPRMYFSPDTTRLNENHFHVSYDLLCLDKLKNDYSNQIDVMSDTLEIIKDLYAIGYLSDYDIELPSMVFPVFEETETTLCGWNTNISIQQKFNFDRCVLPIDSMASGITWDELMEMWNQINQQWNEIKRNN